MFDPFVIITLISSENQSISWVFHLTAPCEGELSRECPEKLCNKTEQSRFLLLWIPSAVRPEVQYVTQWLHKAKHGLQKKRLHSLLPDNKLV